MLVLMLACSISTPEAVSRPLNGQAARLSTSAAQTITGPLAYITFGAVVRGVGDVDADGYDDIVVGTSTGGIAYLYRGSSAGLSATPDQTFTSPTPGSYYFGRGVAGGDINGDGYSDVVIGELGASPFNGALFVYYGGAAGLAATPDLTITGTIEAGQLANHLTTGDVNGDGYADVLAAAPWGVSGGLVLLYLGSSAGLTTTEEATFTGTTSSIGWDVAAGDLSGDGADEIVVGEPGYDGSAGRVLVYGGGTGSWTSPWATIDGTYAGGSFGDQLEIAGDVDGDGYDDLAVSSTYGDTTNGQLDLFRGGPSLATAAFASIDGWSASKASNIAAPGDLDGDGHADVVYAGPGYDSGHGYVEVELGSSSGLTTEFSVVGAAAADDLGTDLNAAGDVNGDGAPDWVAGAPGAALSYGEVTLYLGEVGTVDTGTPDTGDTGTVDTGDTGAGDTATDTGDTGPVDTGPADTGPLHTGDTGTGDTATDTGGPLDDAPADTGDGSAASGCGCASVTPPARGLGVGLLLALGLRRRRR